MSAAEQNTDPGYQASRFAEVTSSHVHHSPTGSGKPIQPLPITVQLTGLPVPGPLVLDRDPLGQEGQVNARHETAGCVQNHLLRHRMQTGQRQSDPESGFLR